MATQRTSQRSKQQKAGGSASRRSVTRNVTAAKNRIVEGVTSSLNVVLLTRKTIEDVVNDAVDRGRMTRNDAQEIIQSLLTRGAKATSDLASDVERIVGRNAEEISDTSGKDNIASASGSLPISGYDDLSAAQVAGRLDGLTTAELRKVRDYERRNANRKTVLEPIERKLR